MGEVFRNSSLYLNMGRKIEPRKKIMQKTVGFRFYQHEFFNKYPEFRPDEFCRAAVDEQIKLIDPSFLEETKMEETKTFGGGIEGI